MIRTCQHRTLVIFPFGCCATGSIIRLASWPFITLCIVIDLLVSVLITYSSFIRITSHFVLGILDLLQISHDVLLVLRKIVYLRLFGFALAPLLFEPLMLSICETLIHRNISLIVLL